MIKKNINSRPLQIAIVGGSLSSKGGGAPRSMALHAKSLTTQNIKVSIFTGYSSKYPLTPDIFGVQDLDIVASKLWGPSVLGLALKSLFALSRRTHEFDVIHLNGHWNLTTFIGAMIARIHKVPYAITARGHIGTYDFKHLWFLKLILYPLMEIPNIKHAALEHVCSTWEQQDSARALSHANNVVKLPNAVDFSEVIPCIEKKDARSQLEVQENALIYLFLSRVAPDKCPDMLIKSWAASDQPQEAILIIAGPASQSYKQYLQNLVITLNIENSVRFVGHVERKQKKLWLSASDVFVLPSTDDSFSVSVIEAVAAGLYCILSPYVGAAEYAPPDQVRIAQLNEQNWASSLTTTSANPDITRQKIAPTWRKQFSAEYIGKCWKKVYEDIVIPNNQRTS